MTDGPRVAIKTFGCKLNQYESEQIREDFEALGFQTVGFDEPADVYVVNSCTVTHRTDRDTRRLARQARRRSPGCMVIVTGCYAEMQPEAVEGLGVVDLVAANERKAELALAAADWLARRGRFCLSAPPEHDPERLVSSFPHNTRAFVKVQTGCNANCTYCTISKARGPSRSVPVEVAVKQADRLARNGHPEIVLVGIHLGMFGLDLAEEIDLDGLVRRICALDSVRRLRLSSIEPMEVSEALVEMVCAGGGALAGEADAPCAGKLCRHLHIPLQSGCDATLARMGRPYETAFYRDLIERIHRREPLVGIGADVMVGFPGETDEEFEESFAFVESLPVSYLHVFTYSERPGTRAAEMPGQVNHEVRKERTHRLRALSTLKAERFAATAVGETLEVVVETPGDRPGTVAGIADNYLRVTFEGPEDLRGALVRVAVSEALGGEVSGELS
ncbi:MAG: tRNA (N(6)-L-threonylcarbamoyladenosine(37)-C(2))-methylthiotransferase MtaB [Armatimonadota bacterium]|jgi:threonylcarbamoyladenosine tRNA methylthiotransferase MtaB